MKYYPTNREYRLRRLRAAYTVHVNRPGTKRPSITIDGVLYKSVTAAYLKLIKSEKCKPK